MNRRPEPTARAVTVAAFRGEPARVEPVGGERHIAEIFKAIK